MPLVIRDQEQSRGDLTISLSNQLGQPIEATSVNYSIKNDVGASVAENLPAIYDKDGKYYAPWNPIYPNGAYVITWHVFANNEVKLFSEKIFILDKNAYPCSPSNVFSVPPSSIPAPGSQTFLSGSDLTPTDLPIYFRDATTGILKDPYSVFYTLMKCNGCAIGAKKPASYFSTGIFWVNERISGETGNYAVKWEYQNLVNEPVNIKYQFYSVICPRNLSVYECKC